MTTQRLAGRNRTGILGRNLAIGGLFGALIACSGGGGGGGGGFDELLFVSDQASVTSFSVSGGIPTARDTATVPGLPGTYARTGTLVTVTIQKHNVPDGEWVLLDFSSGVGGTATDGSYQATFVDDDTFTVVDTVAGSITGGTLLRSPSISFFATYSQVGTTVTITLPNHALDDGDIVDLDYTGGAAIDDNVEIDTVPDVNTFTVVADVAVNTLGSVTVVVGGNYTIFGIAMHPNGRWLYVTSSYDCFHGSPYCWAGDMISRFDIDWDSGGLTFEESFRTSDDLTTEQPAPVTLTFSPDGTRLFHQDDDLDGLRMWSVDPVDGFLTLLASSPSNSTGQHGMAVSADGTRVYHGSRVFVVGTGPDSLTDLSGGSPGEANQILGGTLFGILGGGDNGQIRAFSLVNPDAPAQIAASPSTPHSVRDFALANGGALIVSSGFGGLKSYTYDGATIVPAVGVGDTELRDGGLPFPPSNNSVILRIYRTVTLNAAEDLAAAAYFTNDPNAGNGGIPPSGFLLANVAADGTLSLAGDFPFGTYSRVARFFQKP